VPADAEAVVFADEAEFLASLALDLVRNTHRERWWWRGVIGTAFPGQPPTLARLLRDRPAQVPPALALLASQGCAAEVVQALAPSEAREVLGAICHAYGIDHLAAILDRQPQNGGSRSQGQSPAPHQGRANHPDHATPALSAATAETTPDTTLPHAAPNTAHTGERQIQDAPWAAILAPGAVPPTLERTQACLLGVALTLHARPAAPRAQNFATALQRWRPNADPSPPPPAQRTPLLSAMPKHRPPPSAGGDGHEAASIQPGTKRPAPIEAANTPPPRPHAVDAAAPKPPARAAPLAGSPDGTAQHVDISPPLAPWHIMAKADAASATLRGSMGKTGEGGFPNTARGQPATPDAVPEGARADDEACPPHVADAVLAPTPVAPAKRADEPMPAPGPPADSAFAEGGAETALSGVFFLINLMIALDLPACFEETWQLESGLGAWGVLEALGRALVPPEAAHPGDPLWCALKNLGGCGVDELGCALPDRVDYAMPALWHEHRPDPSDRALYWSENTGTIRVWTAAGYVSNEIFVSPGISEAAGHALAQHCTGETDLRHADFNQAPLADLPAQHCASLHAALRRWLRLVIPFLRLRLARAGIDADPKLFERPGRLFVTSTHVDLVMPENAVWLPVRRAGLDRNPGWLGDFGRIILFHYE
jgi:hypothetical protein